MLFYRQIAVLVLFFTILLLFFVPEQKNITFIILKGLALGGLIIVFFAYAAPSYLINSHALTAASPILFLKFSSTKGEGVSSINF